MPLKYFNFLNIYLVLLALQSCNNGGIGPKTSVSSAVDNSESFDGIACDSSEIIFQPGHVLITGVKNVRLTPVFRAMKNKRSNGVFTGTVNQHYSYDEESSLGDNFNNNLLPGFTTVFGYNLINVSLFDFTKELATTLFKKPVLINNFYYPSDTKDTLRHKPISRDFFMVSVYDKDTNKDGFIDSKDLRHFYLFNLQGAMMNSLIPNNYNVQKSEYDPANDVMYIFAQLDRKSAGQTNESDPTHVFWVNLADPLQNGRLF
jgi:hypothetical protein